MKFITKGESTNVFTSRHVSSGDVARKLDVDVYLRLNKVNPLVDKCSFFNCLS